MAARKQKFDPLDPQRDAVYEAEKQVYSPREMVDLSTLQRFVDEIQITVWFKATFPGTKPLSVLDGRGEAWPRGGEPEIHIPRDARARDVALHELAHCVVPSGCEWHGDVFCGILLFITGKVGGQPALVKLRRAMRRNGVTWDIRLARYGRLWRAGKAGG